jgi:hypothetical protein
MICPFCKNSFELLRPRSSPQNRYYFGVVLSLISSETGHSPEELHEIFKAKYLPVKQIKIAGKLYHIPGTTKELMTSEFEEYLEKIRRFAAQTFSISIPDPEGK